MQPEPKERLVDPETGETPPLSPQQGIDRGTKPPKALILVVDPALRRAWIEGSWEDVGDDGSWEG